MEQEHLIGPIELLQKSLEMYRLKFRTFLPISIVAFAAGVLEAFTIHSSLVVVAIATILGFIVNYLSYIATMYAMSEGDMPPHSYLDFYTRAWKVFVPYILIIILTGFIILGGTVLIIIPGIIASVYISLAVYVVVFEGKKNFSALLQSHQYVRDRWWKVVGRILFLLLVVFLISGFVSLLAADPSSANSIGNDILSSLVSSFFIMPISVSYFYILYISLRNLPVHVASEKTERRIKNQYISLAIVGLAALIIWFITFIYYGGFR